MSQNANANTNDEDAKLIASILRHAREAAEVAANTPDPTERAAALRKLSKRYRTFRTWDGDEPTAALAPARGPSEFLETGCYRMLPARRDTEWP